MANRYPIHHSSAFLPRTGGMGMPPVAMGLTTQQPGVEMANVSMFPGVAPGMWNQQSQVQGWIPPQQQQQQRQNWEHLHKEREYLKQQQKLRAMSYTNKKSPVTADALIENLLGQKETFVLKKNDDALHEKQIIAPDGTLANGSTKSSIPDRTITAPAHHSTAQQRIPPSAKDSIPVHSKIEEKEKGAPHNAGSVLPGTGLPHWANGMCFPPMYDRIWEAVACPLGTGFADTALLFPLLLTSGLQREVLGHIWALTNRTVPGRLVRSELNATLTLIALAQNGHSFMNLSVLEAVPQPIVPNLDLSTLPPPKRATLEVQPMVTLVQTHPATTRADLNAPVTPMPSLLTPSTVQGNSKVALDDDWDEFTEFQSASSTSAISNDPPTDLLSSQQVVEESSSKSQSSIAFHSTGNVKNDKSDFLNSDIQTPILPCIPLSVPLQGNRLLSAESSPVLSSRSSSESRGIGSRLANHTLGAPKVATQSVSSKSQEPSKDDDYDDFCEFRSGPPPSSNSNAENGSQSKISGQDNSLLDDLFPRCVVRPFKPELLRESAIRAEPTCVDTISVEKGDRESEIRDSSISNLQSWMDSTFTAHLPALPKKDEVEEKTTEIVSEVKGPAAPMVNVDKDRYSALRALADEISPDLEAPSKQAERENDEDDDDDDDFGDFLSARGTPAAPVSEDSFTEIAREGALNNKEVSKEMVDDPFNILGAIAAEPQPVNSSDWSADFSAFEDVLPARREINNNDDEFGDFVGGGGNDMMAALRIDAGWPGNSRRGEGSTGTGEASPDSRSINAGALDGESNGLGRTRTGSLPSLDLKGFSVMGVGEGEGSGSSGEEGDGGAIGEGPRGFCSSLAGEKCSLESWDSSKSSDRHAYEWRRCLASCLSLLQSALLIFSSISSGEVIEEVVSTEEGEDYLSNLLEVYWVSRRIAASYQQLDRRDSQLDNLLDDIGAVWEGLMPFYEKSGIMEMDDIRGLDGVRKGDIGSCNGGSYCGVCLALVPGEVDGELSQALSYGGNVYHTTCANLWVNCVDRLLPSLQHFSNII